MVKVGIQESERFTFELTEPGVGQLAEIHEAVLHDWNAIISEHQRVQDEMRRFYNISLNTIGRVLHDSRKHIPIIPNKPDP